MSASEREHIDSLCPHGPEHEEPPHLELVVDPDWSGGHGEVCIFNAEEIDAQWITADESVFVEARQ